MDWFDAFCKERDSLTMEIQGKTIPVNDCSHCASFRNGDFSECCDCCSDAVFEGVMNMCWTPNDEAKEIMEQFKEKYNG